MKTLLVLLHIIPLALSVQVVSFVFLRLIYIVAENISDFPGINIMNAVDTRETKSLIWFVQLSTEKYGVSGDVSISGNKVIIKSFR